MTESSKKSKVLVAGGCGFLGSHLINRLLDMGSDVICIDNLSSGSRNNIANLAGNRHFEFIEHDITKPINLEVNKIYNLACPASPINYQSDPIQTIKTNVYGAINLLDLAVKNKARILQASTSEIYGDPIVHPQREDYWGNVNPVGLRSCYDEGKRCAETLFFDYFRTHKTDIRVVRIFNTYGPLMQTNDGRVVSNFIVQALRGHDITIYGDGHQTRSFCFVDDLIEGFIRYMNLEGGEASYPGPINLGNPNEFTVLQLAYKVLEITGSKSKIIFKPLPSDDPKQRKPDINRAYERLNGWMPKVNLEVGLQKTIVYFEKLLSVG